MEHSAATIPADYTNPAPASTQSSSFGQPKLHNRKSVGCKSLNKATPGYSTPPELQQSKRQSTECCVQETTPIPSTLKYTHFLLANMIPSSRLQRLASIHHSHRPANPTVLPGSSRTWPPPLRVDFAAPASALRKSGTRTFCYTPSESLNLSSHPS